MATGADFGFGPYEDNSIEFGDTPLSSILGPKMDPTHWMGLAMLVGE